MSDHTIIDKMRTGQYYPRPETVQIWDGLQTTIRVRDGPTWLDVGPAWIHKAHQRLPDGSINKAWLVSRKGIVTSTSIPVFAGHGRRSIPEVERSIRNPDTEVAATPEQQRALAEELRAARMVEIHLKCDVVGVGLAVSKADPRIGCSPDGLLFKDGKFMGAGVEIKCPRYGMKKSILEHVQRLQKGEVVDNYDHIAMEDYIQMQVCMYVFNCDTWYYTVCFRASETGSSEQDSFYIEPVKRDPEYMAVIMKLIKSRVDNLCGVATPPPNLNTQVTTMDHRPVVVVE